MIYQVFISSTIAGYPNVLLAQAIFGVPLGQTLPTLVGAGVAAPQLIPFAVLLVALAGLATITARRKARRGVLRLLPYGIALFAAIMPLAVGVYLLTTTAWTVLENAILRPQRSTA